MQRSRILQAAIGVALVSAYGVAQAAPFTSFDPRSMAMGGAGVAVGNAATAPFFNPALLAATSDDDDFALEIPIVGGRLYDPDNFVDAIDKFNNSNVVDDFINARDVFNANPVAGGTVPVQTAMDALDKQLLTLNDKPLQGDVGAAIVVGIPSKKFGMAFTASGMGSIGGVVNYRDSSTLNKVTSDIANMDICYATADPMGCIQTGVNGGLYNYVTFDAVANKPSLNFDPSGADLQSTVDIRGLGVAEFGLSIAREFEIGGDQYAIGITPKVMQVWVFDYEANPNSYDNTKESDYIYQYETVNMDIGVARNFFDGWRAGLVVKNIVPQSFDTYRNVTDPVTNKSKWKKTGNTVDLAPQARFGVSYQASLATLAADVDLTENDPVGYEGASRYVSLGAEFNAWDWAQLRIGYRANTVDSERNVWSAGFGLSPFGIHIDAAVSGNSNEVGGALQFGFRF